MRDKLLEPVDATLASLKSTQQVVTASKIPGAIRHIFSGPTPDPPFAVDLGIPPGTDHLRAASSSARAERLGLHNGQSPRPQLRRPVSPGLPLPRPCPDATLTCAFAGTAVPCRRPSRVRLRLPPNTSSQPSFRPSASGLRTLSPRYRLGLPPQFALLVVVTRVGRETRN